jgi:hypothetical protein
VPLPSPAAQARIALIAALAHQESMLMSRIATLRQRVTQHVLMKSADEATP